MRQQDLFLYLSVYLSFTTHIYKKTTKPKIYIKYVFNYIDNRSHTKIWSSYKYIVEKKELIFQLYIYKERERERGFSSSSN